MTSRVLAFIRLTDCGGDGTPGQVMMGDLETELGAGLFIAGEGSPPLPGGNIAVSGVHGVEGHEVGTAEGTPRGFSSEETKGLSAEELKV